MRYKLYYTATTPKQINQVFITIMTDQQHFRDSILETEDRIIVQYVRRAPESKISKTKLVDFILYVHFSKKDKVFTKICIYKLEENQNETTK